MREGIMVELMQRELMRKNDTSLVVWTVLQRIFCSRSQQIGTNAMRTSRRLAHFFKKGHRLCVIRNGRGERHSLFGSSFLYVYYNFDANQPTTSHLAVNCVCMHFLSSGCSQCLLVNRRRIQSRPIRCRSCSAWHCRIRHGRN